MAKGQTRVIENGLTRCSGCEKNLDLTNFHKDSKRKDGYHLYCKVCRAKIRKIYYGKNGQKIIDNQLTYNYGISPKEYEELYVKQKGLCASCGYAETLIRFEKVARLSVDHCHVTGKIRGLLCSNCNRALGLMCEDPERIKSLLRYTQERC